MSNVQTKLKWTCRQNKEDTYVVRDEAGQVVAMSGIKRVAVERALEVAVQRSVAVEIVEDESE